VRKDNLIAMKKLLPVLPVLALLSPTVMISVQGQSVAPPADRFLEVNGLRLHYVDWGGEGKQPLVMIHGLDRVARTFDHVATRFTTRYRVLAIDMRGHGDSGWDPQGRYLVEDHVGDLEGIVAQLGLRDLVLWGNSTGGRVVQVFAGKHPDLVSRVISEDVGPERPRQIADGYAKRVEQERAGWASAEELLAQLRRANPRMSPTVLDAYVRYGTGKRADGRIEWKRDPQLVKGFVATDLWRFVRNIKAPILYILGGRSTIVPAETQDELRKTLPNAQLITIPDVGHYPSDEQPDEVVRIVDRFLAGEKIGSL
jgi:pimeloyl-ACP methyl ester carboxylesterase